jgi:predicted permease
VLLHDLRLALRELRRRPGLSLAAAVSLALGIGANSAIFSYIDGIYLRPLAVADVGRLARIGTASEREAFGLLSYPEVEEMRRAAAFEGVVAVQWRGANLLRAPEPEGVSLHCVSADFFQVLGVTAERGRVFGLKDESAPVVVLGHTAWKRYFGADPQIVGKAIRLSRGSPQNVTVVGILPPSFHDINTLGDRDLWIPPATFVAISGAASRQEFEDRRNYIFAVLARLRPGFSLAQAQSEAGTLGARLATEFPETNERRRFVVMSDLDYRLQNAGTTGLVLMGVVLLVVAVACVNVANLMLARVEGRRQDLAVRAAIGATRWRLMRQLLVESTLLGALAALMGLAVARWLIDLIPAVVTLPERYQLLDPFRLDARVTLVTLGVSALTILLFSIAPAWSGASSHLFATLKGTPEGTGSRFPLRNVLAVLQVSVSLVLLTAATLLVMSFRNTQTGDIGLARKNIVNVWQSRLGVPLERTALERLRSLPGVRDASLAFRAPLSGSGGGFAMHVRLPGHPEFTAGESPVVIKYNSVEQRYFQVMGIRLLRGRGLTDADREGAAKVAVISESMARRFWPNDDPIGKLLQNGAKADEVSQIVGVVADAPINNIGEIPEPYFYTPWWQNPVGEYTLLIETEGPAAAAVPLVRSTLKQIDPRLERADFSTMQELIEIRSRRYRIAAQLVTGLGVLGLLLTAVGLYGVLAYSVARRTREIGIRMALGAAPGKTAGMVLLGALKLAVLGIVLGLPLAFLVGRAMQALLFGVSPASLASFAITAAILIAVAMITSWLPARRASQVDPILALRSE